MRDIHIDTHNKYICNILKIKTIENISTLFIFSPINIFNEIFTIVSDKVE